MSTLNQDERQPRPFSVANHWSNADHAKTAEYENVHSPSFLNLAPHTAVVTAVLPVGYASLFNQFYNANLASYFHALATMTPTVCNPLVLIEKLHDLKGTRIMMPALKNALADYGVLVVVHLPAQLVLS